MKYLSTLCLTLTLILVSLILLSNGARPANANALAQAGRLTLVDRIGGASLAVAVSMQGDYAFVGQSAEFTVLDISDHRQPRRIAYLPLAANDIALQPSYAFVTNKAGLAVINLADPSHPVQVGFLPTPNALNALAVANNILYASDPRAGLYIIDITKPQQPVPLSFLPFLQIADIAVLGDSLYLATAVGLQIIDVTDAHHPRRIGANDEPSNAEAVVVVGQYAYLTTAEGRLFVIDIADSGQPIAVGRLRIPTFTKNLQVDGDIAYVANGNQGIAVVDVSKRRQPRLLGGSKIGTLVTTLAVVGNSLLATDVSDGGLHILDRRQPARMVEIGVYRTPGIALDVAVNGQYAYLTTGLEGDITIVDHTSRPDLTAVGFYRTPDRTTQVTVSADRLYAYGAQRTLQIFDRTNPTQLLDLGSLQLSRNAPPTVTQAALTFVGDGSGNGVGRLHILDAGQAGLLHEIGFYRALGEITDLAIADNSLLVAVGQNGVLIVKPGAGTMPTSVEPLAVPGYAQRVAAAGDLGYVLTRDGMLYVINLNNSAAIQVVGQIRLGATGRTITVQDGVAYIAAGEAGIYVVDMAQPTQPSLMAVYDTPGSALELAVVADKLWVADGYAGLLVLALEHMSRDVVNARQ